MKKLNAVLIEDEAPSMANLESNLKDLSFLNVVAAVDNMEDGEKEILFHKPDVLFLDIMIHGEPVFKLLERLEPRNLDFGIVFITAYHDDYLKSAIDSCGLRYKFAYLGKPISSARLISTVNKLRKEMYKVEEEDSENILTVHFQSGLTRLFYDEILYCEARGNLAAIFTTDERTEIINFNLKQLQERLPEYLFYRMSGQYLINRQYVRRVYKSHSNYICILRVGANEARLYLPLKQWKNFRDEFGGVEEV
jgi:two-component system LytT family response regulator